MKPYKFFKKLKKFYSPKKIFFVRIIFQINFYLISQKFFVFCIESRIIFQAKKNRKKNFFQKSCVFLSIHSPHSEIDVSVTVSPLFITSLALITIFQGPQLSNTFISGAYQSFWLIGHQDSKFRLALLQISKNFWRIS